MEGGKHKKQYEGEGDSSFGYAISFSIGSSWTTQLVVDELHCADNLAMQIPVRMDKRMMPRNDEE